MATETTTLEAQVSGNVLLYSKPEPLTPEAHSKLGLTVVEKPFDFALTAQAVPLTVTEFGQAGISYPIIFTGGDNQPLAIMSIRPNENLFITDKGLFEFGVYVPAYIRRYPFVLANDETNNNLVVCIETTARALKEGGEMPLFENGQASSFTKQAIEFCTNFETERQRTVSFVQLLKDLDLLESREQIYTAMNPDGSAGDTTRLAEFFAVSEAKLNALPLEKLGELRESGALQQIYVHLHSLLNWDALVARTMTKDGTAPTLVAPKV